MRERRKADIAFKQKDITFWAYGVLPRIDLLSDKLNGVTAEVILQILERGVGEEGSEDLELEGGYHDGYIIENDAA